jgi:CBS domain-containing protein
MSYLVKDFMIKEVNTVGSDENVLEVSKIMAADQSYKGYVIVLEMGKPVGIVTERDLVNKVLAENLDPATMSVNQIMSTPLITIDLEDDLLTASNVTQEHGIRKLVVERDEILYGILTANDIAQNCGDYVDKSVKDILRWTSFMDI